METIQEIIIHKAIINQIVINGDKGAMVINYYVKNKNGVKNSCRITVIKESANKYRAG